MVRLGRDKGHVRLNTGVKSNTRKGHGLLNSLLFYIKHDLQKWAKLTPNYSNSNFRVLTLLSALLGILVNGKGSVLQTLKFDFQVSEAVVYVRKLLKYGVSLEVVADIVGR